MTNPEIVALVAVFSMLSFTLGVTVGVAGAMALFIRKLDKMATKVGAYGD